VKPAFFALVPKGVTIMAVGLFLFLFLPALARTPVNDSLAAQAAGTGIQCPPGSVPSSEGCVPETSNGSDPFKGTNIARIKQLKEQAAQGKAAPTDDGGGEEMSPAPSNTSGAPIKGVSVKSGKGGEAGSSASGNDRLRTAGPSDGWPGAETAPGGEVTDQALSGEVKTPRDAASGQATGKRQHKPASVPAVDADGDGEAEGATKAQDHNSSRSNKSN
jgi:hypothetical protein